jgi:hypothetical protein
MSIGYTKLFSSIVTSTIWVESDRTRIVWITMLAMADRNGEIQASIPGLARLAGVPIPDCEEALAKFIAPDPYSRTPDDEGRRIEKIEGGWALLNHAKYREMASRDDSKASNTERQRRHREKEKRNATVTPRNATVTPSNVKVTHDLHIAEAEAEAEAEARNTHTAPVPVAAGDEAPAADCPFPPEVTKAAKARKVLIDALAACGGADPLQIVASAWSGIGKALADIKGVCPQVTPEEIARRSANYRTHMSTDTILTPHALAKNWALCDKPNPRNKPAQETEFGDAFEPDFQPHFHRNNPTTTK